MFTASCVSLVGSLRWLVWWWSIWQWWGDPLQTYAQWQLHQGYGGWRQRWLRHQSQSLTQISPHCPERSLPPLRQHGPALLHRIQVSCHLAFSFNFQILWPFCVAILRFVFALLKSSILDYHVTPIVHENGKVYGCTKVIPYGTSIIVQWYCNCT